MEISIAKTSSENPEPEAVSLMGNAASLRGAKAPSSLLEKGPVSPELSIQIRPVREEKLERGGWNLSVNTFLAIPQALRGPERPRLSHGSPSSHLAALLTWPPARLSKGVHDQSLSMSVSSETFLQGAVPFFFHGVARAGVSPSPPMA